MIRNDTIAAISTPAGRGGVAMIRISGRDAADIASRCFLPKNGQNFADLPARRAVFGDILCRSTEGAEPLRDSGIAVFYKGPASFTGEDTAELCCHGGTLVQRRALEWALRCGARLAEPGEFSRRALMNGKLSLCEAEALSDLLSAKTDAQLRIAEGGADGRLDRELSDIYSALADTLASLYAKIDFPDEDLADLDAEALLEAAQKAQERVTRLAAGYENTAAIREGIPAVICGLPNTGKSSLYNALAGEELAIVTGEAGTTRDILSSELSCGKVLLRLSDTAGVRETAAEAESIGVCRALGAMERASLILLVFDGSRPLCAEDEALARRASAAPGVLIPVLNKSDLPALLSAADLAALCGTEPSVLSAATGAGVADLRARIENLFLSGQESIDAEPLLCSGRQYSAALRAAEHLSAAVSALETGLPPDCAASDLELALGDLGELDGRAVDEEIVARIFANFCVGK